MQGRNRKKDLWTQGKGVGEMHWERLGLAYIHLRALNRYPVGSCWIAQEFSSVLCGDLEGWGGCGGEEEDPRGRRYMCTHS